MHWYEVISVGIELRAVDLFRFQAKIPRLFLNRTISTIRESVLAMIIAWKKRGCRMIGVGMERMNCK